MNLSKQKAFNERMGKAKHYPKHQNLSKGGMVDRQHFDDGGVATTPQPGQTNVLANATQGGLLGDLTVQSAYQANLAPTQQFNYAPTVGAASNAALNPAAVNSAITAEQGLAGEYGQIAEGQGFNPAIAALNQQTGTNVANTAALQAGQRGGSQNVGLMARQIGQQGAATEQGAVGQAATVESQQALSALGAQGTLQNQIASQGIGEQGVGANVYGTAAGANNAQNNTNVANYAQVQGINAATANANTAATNQTLGAITGSPGAVLAALNKGGEVQKFDAGSPSTIAPIYPALGADTNLTSNLNPNNQIIAQGGPSPTSIVGKTLSGNQNSKNQDPSGLEGLGGSIGSLVALMAKGGKVCTGPHHSHVANYLFADGGNTGNEVKALVSAQEVYLSPHQVKEVVERGADPMKIGHHFPGKDKVKKDSEKNDVIPVTLEDGGVVLPIHITTHKDASEKGRKFVEKAHAKRYMKKPKGI